MMQLGEIIRQHREEHCTGQQIGHGRNQRCGVDQQVQARSFHGPSSWKSPTTIRPSGIVGDDRTDWNIEALAATEEGQFDDAGGTDHIGADHAQEIDRRM